MKDIHTYGKKMARNGRTKDIYKGTFICIQTLVKNVGFVTFQKELKKNFDPEKVKKRASKVTHNRPRSFYFTVQPRPQPTAQN